MAATLASSSTAVRRAVRLLRPILADRLLTTFDPAYESTRRLWNAAVTTRPALIARVPRHRGRTGGRAYGQGL